MNQDLQRLHVAARYSEAAIFNGVVYLAGMVPECEATDIRSQTADVLKQIEQRLAEAGSDKTRILRTQGAQNGCILALALGQMVTSAAVLMLTSTASILRVLLLSMIVSWAWAATSTATKQMTCRSSPS